MVVGDINVHLDDLTAPQAAPFLDLLADFGLSEWVRQSTVLLHPSSSSHWSKLLGFSSNCLAKPSRGGKSRNLTTQIVKQIRQYELGTETESQCCPQMPRTTQAKTQDETIALMAAAKLEDGDVKGAVRLLCSDDRLAIPDDVTFQKLADLHPSAPVDRRPAPITNTAPLQVSTS
jgi:hypothetical protein